MTEIFLSDLDKMDNDIKAIIDALENGTLIKTHNNIYFELWAILEKHKKEIA